MKIYTHIHVYIYIYIFVRIDIYICIYIYIYACICVYMDNLSGIILYVPTIFLKSARLKKSCRADLLY